jgi:hypothetical protein
VPLEFPNLSTFSATLTAVKMASQVEEAECVLWFHESRSVVTVQRRFCTVFGREPATIMSIYMWHKLFDQTGCICKGKSPGRRPVTEAWVDIVRAAFVRGPHKSIRRGARQLNMQNATVQTNLRKRLKFKRYKSQLLQLVTAQDKKVRYTFCSDFLSRLEDDKPFTAKIFFSDKATFHLSGNLHRHNLIIWGSKSPLSY